MSHGIGFTATGGDAGKPASFRSDALAMQFIARYRGAIRWSINSWSIPAHERADVYQDVAVKVIMRFRRHGPLQDEAQGGRHLGYVLRICRNVCLDHTRRNAVRAMAATSAEADARVRDHEALPDAQLFRKEADERLRLAIEELPPMSKAVMRLVIKGWTNMEIADYYGISHTNVKQLQHRARKLLRERLVRR